MSVLMPGKWELIRRGIPIPQSSQLRPETSGKEAVVGSVCCYVCAGRGEGRGLQEYTS